tara:strand:+ start:193 stop:489 length:297 start_codon:yes stop_codon:yes gene_type:complete
MAETVKFSEDEMKSLSELQDTYQQLTQRMGQLEAQRIVQVQGLDSIDTEKDSLKEQWMGNQQKERELVDNLNKKYGPGTLDPNSGEFTPTPAETPQQS